MSAGWAAALAAFEERLAALERALEGDGDVLAVTWPEPTTLQEPPDPAQRARAQALLDRAAACERRLAAQMRAIAEELRGVRAVGAAASRYRAGASTPAGAVRRRAATGASNGTVRRP